MQKMKSGGFTFIAVAVFIVGIIDILVATNVGRHAYRGILSFIVGRSNYTSAIIAALIWIVAIAVLFVLAFKKSKGEVKETQEIVQQNLSLLPEKLAAANFTSTSAYNLLSDFMLSVDSNSKRIAFTYLKRNAETRFIDFDSILSCEIVRGEETSKSTGMASHVGNGVGFGMSTTEKRIASIKILLTLKSIDNPILEIDLISPSPMAVFELGLFATVGGGIAANDHRLSESKAFAEKVKSVVDNIIAMRD